MELPWRNGALNLRPEVDVPHNPNISIFFQQFLEVSCLFYRQLLYFFWGGAGGGGVNLQSSWTQKNHETKPPLEFMFHGYRSGFLGQRRKSLRLEVKLIFDTGFVLCMKYLTEGRGCRLDSQPSGMKDCKRIFEATTINFASFLSQCHEHDPLFTHRLLSANIRTLAVNGKIF